MDDSRLNVTLGLTAIQYGSSIANHMEVESLIKDNEKVCGAIVRDVITGERFPIHSKVVINATGPFVDSIRKMSDPKAKRVIQPSAGIHIILPDYYSPNSTGLIVPKTKVLKFCLISKFNLIFF